MVSYISKFCGMSSETGGGSLPTPTTMDSKKDGLKHATKLYKKTHRASGQPIQVTLSDKVMMEKNKTESRIDDNLSESSDGGKTMIILI